MTRISTLIVVLPPTRWNSSSYRTRSSLACVIRLISAIASRKIAPSWAISNHPGRSETAPVKAPLDMAKQLALQDAFGQRRTVHRDQGFVTPFT